MVLPAGHPGNLEHVSPANRFRAACYCIEGVNSFAVVLYFNYLYFFFRDRFGFNDRQNLELAALIGLVYTIASWQAGRFAQRCGYFTALKLGFGLLAAGLWAGLQLHTVAGEIAMACVANVGMCFIWPTIEALVIEGDTPEHVPHAVGLYNITWAVTNAAAFFIGGTIIKKLGYHGAFSLSLTLIVLEFLVVFWLERIHPVGLQTGHVPAPAPVAPSEASLRARNFQRMALLANPSAYIAINTLIAVLPGIAAKFHLSTMLAGFALSLWCFARFATFIVLWRWTAWHYRFRWLASAFAFLIGSFATILVAPNLAAVLAAQIVFGVAIGLIYYSSLFYSLDASEAKGEHGGIHEAAIGVGNCFGPAIGASALWFAPANASVGAWAVSGLLTAGFGGLFWIRSRSVHR
jgi:predicted MFS family arabinose efflux permease